jgi:uncharacterized OB-fold protein
MGEYRGMEIVLAPTDTEFRPYLEDVARRGWLVLRACGACGLMRYPSGAGCPFCGDLAWTWQEVSGKGTIASYEVVTQAIQPGFADWVPYVVVLVDLDEQRGVPTPEDGLRVVTNLVRQDGSPEEEAAFGINSRVEVTLQPFADGLLLPQFRLSGEAPSGPVWRLPE